MDIRIEVVSTHIETIKGTSKAGNAYTVHKQEAYLHNGHAYPERFEVSVPEVDGKPAAYEPGFYEPTQASIVVGDYKSLEFSRFDFKLVRLPDAPAKPAGKADAKPAF